MSARLGLKKQIIEMKLESFTKTSLVPLRVGVALTQGCATFFTGKPLSKILTPSRASHRQICIK